LPGILLDHIEPARAVEELRLSADPRRHGRNAQPIRFNVGAERGEVGGIFGQNAAPQQIGRVLSDIHTPTVEKTHHRGALRPPHSSFFSD
jgi:hypothetical protein